MSTMESIEPSYTFNPFDLRYSMYRV
jgi:hypothetical protein